ncbi:MAG: hypothetical protein NTY36_17015 [Deltaproteobacteria bacterium]|nr:hypothetical protein [Deltaproteobacteria bacterium]
MDKQEITFPNGHKAQLVAPPLGTPAADILKSLEIPAPKALLLLIGGASSLDQALVPRLLQLFSRNIARIAADAGALIMDGGTQAGVMAIMGQAIAARGHQSPLLGVAPAAKVTYPGGPPGTPTKAGAPLDPNHSYFVLVANPEWGDETETFYELAESLAPAMKVVTILVNGGPIATTELLASVRRGWPIIVMTGTGRLADEIAALSAPQPGRIIDPAFAEIIADGDLHLFSLNDPPENLEQLLLKGLQADSVLSGRRYLNL